MNKVGSRHVFFVVVAYLFSSSVHIRDITACLYVVGNDPVGKNNTVEEMGKTSFCREVYNKKKKKLGTETLVINKLYSGKSSLYFMFLLEHGKKAEKSKSYMYCHGNIAKAYYLKTAS